MIVCTGYYANGNPAFSRSTRQCGRPQNHDGQHGPLGIKLVKFDKARAADSYLGMEGHEVGGALLSFAVLDAIGRAKTTGKPCEFIVTGEWLREDGRRYLNFASPTAFIESVTDFRHDPTAHKLRYVCPECEQKDGRHLKSCSRERK